MLFSSEDILEDIQRRLREIDVILADPDSYVYDYFEEIKRQVDLRRENLKQEIDEYSDEIIQTINQKQRGLAYSKGMWSEIELDSAKTEILDLLEVCDPSDCDVPTLLQINSKLNARLEKYKFALTGNKDYEFKLNTSSIEKIFGSFTEVEQFKNSSILDKTSARDLISLCEFSQKQKWELIYRATEDGFSADSFHTLCDGIENTLTVVKVANGNIFGGYAEAAWNSNNKYVNDDQAFVFSLVNLDKSAFKVKCTDKFAIYCNAGDGPSFGFNDLCISSDANENEYSYSNFSISYKHPDYEYGTGEAQSILAGSFKFRVVDIEVFTKQFV